MSSAYQQCFYYKGVLIPQCDGSAVHGCSGCTCPIRPRKDNAALPVQVTTRQGVNAMAAFKRKHPGFKFYE